MIPSRHPQHADPWLSLPRLSGSSSEPPAHMASALLGRRTSLDGFSSFIDVASRFTRPEKIASQLTTCIIAGLGLLASSVAIYWFARMRKLFRHKLIMLLLAADFGRSVWVFVFTTAALSGADVGTHSNFCQATGYLTQVSIEAADLAILLIAIHTSLQVFRPNPVHRDRSGLYRWRNYVYFIWAATPVTVVALAFLQGHDAFNYNGLPICNLPVRPFWYRLAISWIPRYVILIVIVVMNVCIYIYAGYGTSTAQFYSRHQAAGDETDGHFTLDDIPRSPLTQPPTQPSTPGFPPNHSLEFLTSPLEPSPSTMSPFHTYELGQSSHDRRASDGTTLVGSRSTRASSADDSAKVAWSPPRPFYKMANKSPPNSTISENRELEFAAGEEARIYGPAASAEPQPPRPTSDDPIGKQELRARRSNARRQLRMMFVYPTVYFSVWIIPFVNHVLQYDNWMAEHPIYALTFITWVCVAGIGIIDAVVFSLREQPWRHIPGSDGTVLGSFRFWEHATGSRRSSHAVSNASAASDTEWRHGSALGKVRRQARRITSQLAHRDAEREPPDVERLDSRIGARIGMHSWEPVRSAAGDDRRAMRGHERYWFERQYSFALEPDGGAPDRVDIPPQVDRPA